MIGYTHKGLLTKGALSQCSASSLLNIYGKGPETSVMKIPTSLVSHLYFLRKLPGVQILEVTSFLFCPYGYRVL